MKRRGRRGERMIPRGTGEREKREEEKLGGAEMCLFKRASE